MSTFSFNKIFILESLPSSELQTGTELEKRLNQWAPSKGIDCQVVTFQVHSMQDWETAWMGIFTSIEKMGNIPIIHLEMHGNKAAIGIDGGVNGIIPLKDVFQKVQHANVLSQNNVFLSLAVCMGLNVIRSLKVYEPMPFCGVLGSLETLKNDELLENYTIFYKAFLSTLNLDKAKQIMKESGVDATKYELYKPEQIFMNAYLGYLESYKTDEQIREKAMAAAKRANIIFQNEDGENLFVRDYRCSLLLTGNREYKRAVDLFFMFDRYPNIHNRFVVPNSIYDFKQYAAKGNNEWFLQRRYLSVEEVKWLSIKILEEVDKFCAENSIKYSLAYGTLIGAVRHKGFIPWDDDIDIIMLRDDYERFIKLFNHDETKLFSVVSYESDRNIHYPFAKIVCNATVKNELGYTRYGQAIDLFPIDKISADKQEYTKLIKKQKLCWNLFMLKSMKWNKERGMLKNFFMCFAKVFTTFISYSFINKWMRNNTSYDSLDSDNYYLGCLFTPYGVRELMPKDVFADFTKLPFDQNYYSAIKEYDKYLKKLYGDYMKLPPVEQQITHHEFNTWWK